MRWMSKLKDYDFIVDYNADDENIDKKQNKKPTSLIGYNKHEKITEKDYDKRDAHYEKIATQYYGNDDEAIDENKDSIKWSRTEMRLKFNGTDTKQYYRDKNGQLIKTYFTPKLNVYNKDGTICVETFDRLKDIIKKKLNKLEVVIFQNKNKLNKFIKDYKEQPVKALKRIGMSGNILKVDENDVDKIINNLMSNLSVKP
jgi:hypothetical protein